MSTKDYRFEGFTEPNFTPCPDGFFDELAPNLSEAELRVCLYIIRRTFGFKKRSDGISLTQLVGGIKTKDGKVLDRGTGMSRPGVIKGVHGLVEKDVIEVDKALSDDGVNQVNVYRLRFRPEVVNDVAYGSQPRFVGVGNEVDPQETVEQQTEKQETDSSNDSNDVPLVMSREDAERIAWVVKDIAREFADQAPVKSSATRAYNLFLQSGLTLDAFLDVLQQARLRTKRYTGSIKTDRLPSGDKPKMSYFFAVIEDLIGTPPLDKAG